MASPCPIFRPSFAEFVNLNSYIAKINAIAQSHGICKIVPPSGWHDPSLNGISELDVKIKCSVSNQISGYQKVYSVTTTPEPENTPDQWNEAAEAALLKRNMKLRKGFIDERKLELSFWKALGSSSLQNIPVAYDLPMGIFKPEEAGSSWNLATVESPVQQVLRDKNLTHPGITSSTLCLTQLNSVFPMTNVSLNLYNVNYLHTGYGRSWYAVPHRSRQKLGKFLASKYRDSAQECRNLLGHRRCLVHPDALVEQGITVTRVAQKPGELVVVFPGASHFGFAHGVNAHEDRAFSLDLDGWFPYCAQAPACDCSAALSQEKSLVFEVVPPEVLKEAQKEVEKLAKKEGDGIASIAVAKQRRFVSNRVRKVKEISTERLERRKRRELRRLQRDKEEKERRKLGPNFYEGVKAYLKHEGEDADTKEPIEVVVTKLKHNQVYCRTLQEWDAGEDGNPQNFRLDETDPRWTKKPRFRVGKVIKITQAPKSMKQVEAMVKKIMTVERKLKVAYMKPSENEDEEDIPIVEEFDFDSDRIVLNRRRNARKRRREKRLMKEQNKKKRRRNPFAEYWAKKRGLQANGTAAADAKGKCTNEDMINVSSSSEMTSSLNKDSEASVAQTVESEVAEQKEPQQVEGVAETKGSITETSVEDGSTVRSAEDALKEAEREERKRKRRLRRKNLPPAIKEVQRKLRKHNPDTSGVLPQDRVLLNFQVQDMLKFEKCSDDTRGWMTVLEGVRSMSSLTSFPYQEKCRKIVYMTQNERVRSLLLQISHAGAHYSPNIIRAMLHKLYNSVCRARPELYTDFIDPKLVVTNREYFLPTHELAMFLQENIKIRKPKEAIPYILAMVDKKRGIIREPGVPRHPALEKKNGKRPKKQKLQIYIPVNGWNVVEYIRDIQFKFRMRHPVFNGSLEKIRKWRKKDAVKYVRKIFKQLKRRRQNIRDLVRVRNASEAVYYVQIMSELMKANRQKKKILDGTAAVVEEIEEEA